MKRILLLSAVIYFFPGGSFAQSKRAPRFEDYPVRERFRGKPARINFHSCSLARTFRTMLRVAVDGGVKFAGNYGVNYWGCGTECVEIGIVNLKNGRVYMPPFAANVGVETRANSRLLVVNPPARLKEEFGDEPLPDFYFQTRYYLWKDNQLVLIYPQELVGKIRDILKSCEPK
jgi:hypothetical protein